MGKLEIGGGYHPFPRKTLNSRDIRRDQSQGRDQEQSDGEREQYGSGLGWKHTEGESSFNPGLMLISLHFGVAHTAACHVSQTQAEAGAGYSARRLFIGEEVTKQHSCGLQSFNGCTAQQGSLFRCSRGNLVTWQLTHSNFKGV